MELKKEHPNAEKVQTEICFRKILNLEYDDIAFH